MGIEVLDIIQRDPEFAKLSYNDQIKVRMKLLVGELPKDAEFNSLDVPTKDAVMKKLSFREPAFENYQVARDTAAVVERAKQEMAQFNAQSKIVRTTAGQGGVSTPAINLMKMNVFAWSHNDEVSMQNLFVEKGATWLWKNFIKPLTGEDVPYQLTARKDFLKQRDYYEYLLSQEKAHQASTAFLKGLGGISGFVTDLVAWNKLTAGTLKAPRGLAAATMMGVDSVASRIPRVAWAVKTHKLGLGVAHAVGEGISGLARESVKEMLARNLDDEQFQFSMQKAAGNFGKYAAADFLYFGVTAGVWNMAKAAGRSLTVGWRGPNLLQRMSEAFVKGSPKEVVEEATEQMARIFAGKSMDPAFFGRLDDVTKKIFLQATIASKVLNNVDELAAHPEWLVNWLAHRSGFVAEQVGPGKWSAFETITGEATKKTLDTDGVLKWMSAKLNAVAPPDLKGASAAAGKVKVTKSIEAALKGSSLTDVKTLTQMIAPVGGKLDSKQVLVFAKALTRGAGVSDDIVRTVKVAADGDKIRLVAQGREIASVPALFTGPGSEEQVAKKLISAINEFSESTGASPKPEVLENFLKGYKQQLIAEKLYSPDWVMYAAKKLNIGVDPNTFAVLDQGVAQTFGSWNEVGDYIVRKSLDKTTVKKHLAELGLSVSESADKTKFSLKRGTKVLDSAETLDELLEKHPALRPKMDSSLGPEFTLIDEATVGVKYTGPLAYGNTESVMNHLSGFKDGARTGVKIPTEGKKSILWDSAKKTYEVYLPEIEHRVEFGSFKAAKEYLATEWDSVAELRKAALLKGYRLEGAGGRWVMYTEKGEGILLDHIDDVKSQLAKVKTPEWAPELTGLDSELAKMAVEVPDFNWKPTTFDPIDSGHMSAGWVFPGRLISPPDSQFVSAARRGGVAGKPLEFYRMSENAVDAITIEDTPMFKMVDDIFRPVRKRAKREAIGQLLETPVGDWTKKAEELGLSTKEVEVANLAREFWGTSKTKGAFQHFGVDPELFQTDYLPRIRKYINDTSRDIIYTETDFGGVIRGAGLPTAVEPWFKHARVTDLVTMARETDPLVLMKKYVTMGNRAMFLNPVIDNVRDWMKVKANSKALDPTLKQYFLSYLADIRGIPSNSERIAKDFTKRLYSELDNHLPKNLQGKLKNSMGDALTVFTSTGYLSAMGFRPWPVIRNHLQVFTTLSPRVGLNWVTEAMDVVAKDARGTLFEKLAARGVLLKDMPVAGGELLSAPNEFFAKLGRAGLRFYRDSDDWTRAVAYTASELRFRDAWKYFGSRLGDPKQLKRFVSASGLSKLDFDLRDKAMALIQRGNVESALDLFASTMTKETMFLYRAGAKPLLFKGTVGKLFGMFGQYPIWFKENLVRAMRNSTFGEKVGYLAALGTNMAALYGAAKAVGVNFQPWQAFFFSGGPYYGLMNDLLTATMPGYEGRQKRASLFGIKQKDGQWFLDPKAVSPMGELGQWFVPGSFAFKSTVKGLQYLNDGDDYLAFLSFASAPIIKEWQK